MCTLIRNLGIWEKNGVARFELYNTANSDDKYLIVNIVNNYKQWPSLETLGMIKNALQGLPVKTDR